MSWSEMEKELAADHGVPIGQLRKVRLVSELQGLLEQHRSVSDVDVKLETVLEDEVAPLPARHLSMGDSTDASDSSDANSTGKSSPELPTDLCNLPEDKKDVVQSLLMVAPRARSDSIDMVDRKTSEAMLLLPPQVTPMQSMRSISVVTGQVGSVNSIDPNTRKAIKNSEAQMSPARLSTASILGKLGGRPELSRIPPKMRFKTSSQVPEAEDEEKEYSNKIGDYSPKARKALLAKFHEKRQRRVWKRKVRYDCRKDFANNRVRVKGRFVKKKEGDDSSYLLLGRPRSDSMASDCSVDSRPRSDSICSTASDIIVSRDRSDSIISECSDFEVVPIVGTIVPQ